MCTSAWWLLLAFPLVFTHPRKDGSDEKYAMYAVQPGAPIRVFAYRPGVAALVYESASQGIVIQLQRVDSFERSSPFIVKETAHPHQYRIEACFERDGQSHMLAYDTALNETLFIKGQEESSLPLRDYEFLRYDFIEDAIYLARNRTLLRYPFEGILRYNDIGEPQERPEVECEITERFTDLMVVGGQPFAIFDQSVNKQLPNGSWTRIMATKSSVFWFQLFPVEQRNTASNLTHLSPAGIVFIIEILVLLFAAYCLNMKLKVRPQSGIYELSRGSVKS